MKLIYNAFNFYISASIHIALAILAMVGVTLFEYNLEVPFILWPFVFFGSITGYNFVKFAKIAGLKHSSLTNSFKLIQLFSFLCFGITVFFAFQLSLKTFITVGIFGLLTFFYAVPLLKQKNLRTFSGLKIFVVALVWAGVTVFVPMIASEMKLTLDVWLTFIQRFFIVVTLTLPFEIRDLQYDVSALRTLPQQLGLKRTKRIGIFLLVVCVLLEGFKIEFSWEHFSCLFLICTLIGRILLVSEIKQTKYFAAFWVESIPIIWFLLFLFLDELF